MSAVLHQAITQPQSVSLAEVLAVCLSPLAQVRLCFIKSIELVANSSGRKITLLVVLLSDSVQEKSHRTDINQHRRTAFVLTNYFTSNSRSESVKFGWTPRLQCTSSCQEATKSKTKTHTLRLPTLASPI